MQKLRFKLIGGFVLLVVLCVLFYRIQFAGNASVALAESLAQHRTDIYDTAQVLEMQAAQQAIAQKELTDSLTNTLQLYGEAIKSLEENTDIDGIERYAADQNMAVIHIADGVIQQPEALPAGLLIDQKDLSGEKGSFSAKADDGKTYINYYSRLSGDEYLLWWEDSEKSLAFDYFQNDRADTIRSLEDALEIYILEFQLLDGADMTLAEPVYAPEAFSDYHTAQDYGITSEMLYSAVEMERDRFIDSASAASEPLAGGRSLTVGDVQYECYLRKTNGGSTVTIFMIPSDRPVARASERTALLLAVFAILGFSFLTWALSVFVLVIRHSLDSRQKKIFLPRRIYRQAAVFITSEILSVAGVSIFLQCLFANFHVSATAEGVLRAIDARLESGAAMADVFQTVRMKNLEASAEAIGLLAASDEERVTPAFLDSACEAVGADYIILYDETGTQVMSNTAYSALTLADGGEDMQDFSRLLKGASPISKASVTDAQTSQTHAVFGTSLPRTGDDGRDIAYWAMLLFVNPDRVAVESALATDELMQSVDSSGTICFCVDQESGRILSASDRHFIGKEAVSLGLPQDAVTDHYRGFFWLDGVRVYGISAEINGSLFFYTVSLQQIYQHIPQNTCRGVLTYLVLMAVLAVFLLFGYRKTFELYADRGEALHETDNLIMTPSGQFKESTDPSLRWKFTEAAFGSRTPIHNALLAGEAVYMIAMIITALYTQIGPGSTDRSAIAYILSGRWSRGFNLFAITSILFLFAGVTVVTIFCKFVIAMATRNSGTKGETIGRLLLDCIRYLSVIVFAYYALSFIGVDTAALVASLGIITFALSLGAQDLIRDILAGLSIVMEGEYQVGDIIEVNKFRGTVLAVGVRTTKIEGRGGNILIMGNRDIKNVINKTRKNSWYALNVNIADSENLGKVEALLAEHLPQIGRAIPEIISGPFYKGVVEITRGTLSLSIIAECMEADYHKVQRKLNGAVAILFEEHGIAMK